MRERKFRIIAITLLASLILAAGAGCADPSETTPDVPDVTMNKDINNDDIRPSETTPDTPAATVVTPDEPEDSSNAHMLEGVTMEVEESSVSGTGLTIVLTNNTDNEITYGSDFKLETMAEETWTDCEFIIENGAFTSEGYDIAPGKSDKQEVDWEWLYGTLNKGRYRITKGIALSTASDPEGYVGAEITAEFNIQ
jgi:hypothetical protein